MSHTQTSNEPVLSREVAEQELERFLIEMDLVDRTDASRLDAEDKKKLCEVRENLVRALMSGSLRIDDDGCPVYTPRKGDPAKGELKPVKFHEPTGADLAVMDKYKQTQGVAKQNALLGAMTGEGPSRFAVMKQRDLTVCSDLLMLFLA